ncbi:MAG: ATP synthase F0 subunit C [Oligoflexales bacterium]|nr:ATP synthase F0 subunit C [Oligoflexales bacterium]
MKRVLLKAVVLGMGLLSSSAVLAEVSQGADASSSGLAKIGAAIAIALGALGAATGQGKAASAALEGIARNPSSRGDVFVPLILSLVFMEFQALLCFVIALNLAG